MMAAAINHANNNHNNLNVPADDEEARRIAAALVNAHARQSEDLVLAARLMAPLSEDPLTEDELQWAHDIKTAVESNNNNNNEHGNGIRSGVFSDYDYASYAIVTQGDIETALEKMEKMQAFREEYRIHNTLEEGMELLHKLLIEQQPCFVLDVDYEPMHQHFVLVHDYSRANPSAVDTPDDFRVWFGGLYYLHCLLQASLPAIQQGLVKICDVQSMGWKNFSVDLIRKTYHHFFSHYPLTHKEISWIHSSVIANLQHSLLKSLIGARANKIQIGCQVDGVQGKLEKIFLTPTPAIAQARILSRCRTFLTARFHNQQVYRLPELPAEDVDVDDADSLNEDDA